MKIGIIFFIITALIYFYLSYYIDIQLLIIEILAAYVRESFNLISKTYIMF